MVNEKYPKPGVYLGDSYLGRLPFGSSFGEGAKLVGAKFAGGKAPQWMTDDEFAALSDPRSQPAL
jgi:hypothetical protein